MGEGMTSDGASSRPPEGRNNTPDPSWTPKEPNRPLRPKPGSFGVSKSFPLPTEPYKRMSNSELNAHLFILRMGAGYGIAYPFSDIIQAEVERRDPNGEIKWGVNPDQFNILPLPNAEGDINPFPEEPNGIGN